jgi:pimeloyl-ACP methyl ester carboxylesterase
MRRLQSRPIRILLASVIIVIVAVTAVTQLRGQSAASTQMVTVNGRVMRVRTQGLDRRQSGQAVVVLEAGAGSGLEAWDPVFSPIAELAPVIAYDRRGLGQSEIDGEPQTIRHVADSLHALLNSLQVPPPYVMVGQSYGGILIRAYAQTYPTEVTGLVYLEATDVEVTYAEVDGLPAGARQVVFNEPVIPPNTPPGPKAEMDNILRNIRSEFAEVRAARPPSHIPAAVVIGAGKSWPGATPEIAAALLRLQIKHQQEWVLGSPQGLMIVSKHLRHMVHQNDPGLTVRVIQHVLSAAAKH